MNLRMIRQKAGLTQTEIARQLGKSPNTVTQWESGDRQPRASLLPRLASILGCTVDELLRDPDQNKTA